MKWKDSLRTWRRDRNITQPQGTYVSMITEELEEYIDAQNDSDIEGMIDAIADIIVLSTNEMELMGYDLDMVMKQVLKEISSRVQDPTQLQQWLTDGPSGKWQKDRNQDPSTLYTADFSTCRLSRP